MLLSPVIAELILQPKPACIVAQSGQISWANLALMFILYVVLFCTYVPSYLWAKNVKKARNQ